MQRDVSMHSNVLFGKADIGVAGLQWSGCGER